MAALPVFKNDSDVVCSNLPSLQIPICKHSGLIAF